MGNQDGRPLSVALGLAAHVLESPASQSISGLLDAARDRCRAPDVAQ
jgi:hypothetical protein